MGFSDAVEGGKGGTGGEGGGVGISIRGGMMIGIKGEEVGARRSMLTCSCSRPIHHPSSRSTHQLHII